MEIIERKDIFDKMMSVRLLNRFYPIYKKNKTILLYLFFGGMTFVLNVVVFTFLRWCRIPALLANVLSWWICVMIQYFTNRTWVFTVGEKRTGSWRRELASFIGGRVLTLAIEEVILVVFIVILSWSEIIVKIFGQVVVILSNYFISKYLVFK